MMKSKPPRERPRRGAWWGSRRARAGAAACLLTVVVGLALPGPAAAYRCGSTQAPDGAQATAMFQDCRAEAPPRRQRPNKRGSVSSLTVLVLAIAGALLLPIGARGIPYNLDPYSSQDRPY